MIVDKERIVCCTSSGYSEIVVERGCNMKLCFFANNLVWLAVCIVSLGEDCRVGL